MTAPEAGAAAPRPAAPLRRLAVRWVPVIVLLGLAIHLLLPQIGPLERALDVARSIPPFLLALAALAQGASYAGNGYLLRRSVALLGERLTVRRGAWVTLGAAAVGLVGGGTVGNAAALTRWLRTGGVTVEAALLAGWLATLLNPTVEVALGLLGLLWLLFGHTLPPVALGATLLGALVLGALAALAVLAWTRPDAVERGVLAATTRIARLRKRPVQAEAVRARMRRLRDGARRLTGQGWRGPAAGAGMNVGFDLLTLHLLFVAAGHPLDPGVLLAGYGVPIMLGKLTVLPGGLGVVEAGMTGIFQGLGVPAAVTVVVVLLYRLLSFWLPTMVGIVAAILLHRASGPAPPGEPMR